MGQADHKQQADKDSSGTVLVVEDEVLVRMTTADHFRSKGYRVIEAETADEAALVMQAGEAVDVVFADVQLPGSMGGLSLAVWIHTHFPDTQVILTSGNATVMENLRSGTVLANPTRNRPRGL